MFEECEQCCTIHDAIVGKLAKTHHVGKILDGWEFQDEVQLFCRRAECGPDVRFLDGGNCLNQPRVAGWGRGWWGWGRDWGWELRPHKRWEDGRRMLGCRGCRLELVL